MDRVCINHPILMSVILIGKRKVGNRGKALIRLNCLIAMRIDKLYD